jgi:hypothetical protein
MHRRTLLRWLVSGAAAWPLRGVHLHAQAAALSAASVGTLRALAPVLLPSEIGAAGHDKVVGDFIQWLASYRAGAERGWGYGHPSPSRTPDIRTSVYDTQLQSLEDWPRIRGSEFASISLELRAAIVSEALDAEKIRAMPGLPNGGHVVTDFMSFYFRSDAANDLAYRARIGRTSCRGLAGAERNPAS